MLSTLDCTAPLAPEQLGVVPDPNNWLMSPFWDANAAFCTGDRLAISVGERLVVLLGNTDLGLKINCSCELASKPAVLQAEQLPVMEEVPLIPERKASAQELGNIFEKSLLEAFIATVIAEFHASI